MFKKKYLSFCVLILFLAFLIGCSFFEKPNQSEWGEIYTTYTAYSKAQSLGYAGSYQEFMESIKGKNGIDGVGIDIVKIVEGELIITFSNGTTFNLGRVEGEDGVSITNVEVVDGELIITLSNGQITNVGKVAGIDGINGKSAYELYKETYDYKGTEREWLEDLVNGNLATIKKHIVTFNLNGGSGEIDNQEVKHGEKLIQPINPIKEGYTFKGWYLGDEKWSFIGYVVTEDMILDAKWELMDFQWSIGTLLAVNGQHNKSDTTRLSTLEYIPVNAFEAILISSNYQLTWLAYDENKKYIGNGSTTNSGVWLEAGKTLFTNDILMVNNNDGKNYGETAYIRIAIKRIDGQSLTLDYLDEDVVDFVDVYEYPKYAYFGEAILNSQENYFSMQNIKSLGSGQDGTYYGDYWFIFSSTGIGKVYDKKNHSFISEFILDKKDIILPHCNSVCFGNKKYDEKDEFPLLYANVYNSYANQEDQHKGMCLVYRLTRDGSVFTSELIQIIKVEFTENTDYWKSLNVDDARPYGNFVVDTDHDKLYCFVMRDEEKTTRFFEFDLPSLNSGNYSEEYDTVIVSLNIEDIVANFDCEYFNYMQGCCYYGGYLFSLEGFSNKVNPPCLRIVDLSQKKVTSIIDFSSEFMTVEPEMITICNGEIYINFINGEFYKMILY